jgi:eukaryotic-like serine/threonine-protein kinase
MYRDIRAVGQVFPMAVALRIMADACAGLHAVHELCSQEDGRPLEVVHRDVSPQNLLISVRGTTKLIDFGVAKARARRSEETAAGTLKGKIEYMAPEQAKGDPLDRRADVFSIGAMLYELLAGRPVRNTEDGRQLAALHELMTGVPYTPLPRGIPDIVCQLVDRALAQDPAHRFPTADALRHALDEAMMATGQTATSDEVASVLGTFSRERTAKRRDAIDRAIRAATEGALHAVAATLIAPVSSRQVTQFMADRPPLPPSSYPLLDQLSPSGTAPSLSLTGPHLPRLQDTTRRPLTEPVSNVSHRTMQGAALGATTPPPPTRTSFGKILLGAVVLAIASLLGVVAGMMWTKRQSAQAALAVPPPAPVPLAMTTEAPPATTTPPPAAIVVDTPAAPATGTASVLAASGKDAGVPASGKRGGGSKGPRSGSKPGEGDEYGF